MSKIYKGVVLRGDQTGREIGFPTVNLDPSILSNDVKTGIYACWVTIDEDKYMGSLYFGPRLVKNETKNVLEVHIIDFNENIYDEEISFELVQFIRDIKNFENFDELIAQIKDDVSKSVRILQQSHSK